MKHLTSLSILVSLLGREFSVIEMAAPSVMPGTGRAHAVHGTDLIPYPVIGSQSRAFGGRRVGDHGMG